MADSDEESERHRCRDKFRRERSDYDGRRRPGDKREPFDERSGTLSGGFPRVIDRSSDIRSTVDRERSPITEPPYKRSRREYNDDNRNAGPRRRDPRGLGNPEEEEFYRPPLVPFKRFLEPLDELITEEEACTKYREYKESYTKRHIEEFFEAHKNEEWLRFRYHPDFAPLRKEAMSVSLKHRLAVFMELFGKGFFDNQSVQMDNSENLIRLMDAVVIKLEGGTDEDLKVLDSDNWGRCPDEDESQQKNVNIVQMANTSGHRSEEGEAESDLDAGDSVGEPSDSEVVCTTEFSGEEKLQTHLSVNGGHAGLRVGSRPTGGSASSLNSSDDEHSGPNLSSVPCPSVLGGEDIKGSNTDRRSTSPCEPCLATPGDTEEEDAPTPTTAEPPDGSVEIKTPLAASASIEPANNEIIHQRVSNSASECAPYSSSKSSKKYPLHKTASIFFRALPPSVTESELKDLCASQPGFLRLALWEPVPERRFTRHAWATYKPTVNIKKICWALNTSPLVREKMAIPNGELGATVNRDLAQRVRPLTPLTRHKPIMRHDLILAAQLVARLDSESHLWEATGTEVEKPTSLSISDKKSIPALLRLAIQSQNPLLKNLTDYLVDEGGSEEEALLAETNQNGEDGNENTATNRSIPVVLESDSNLARVLDHLILYLRVVHSVDFYAGTVYPMEDMMPHRCGILHARGDRGLNPTVPGGRSAGLVFTQREVDDHLHNFELKLRVLIDVPKDLSEDEMKKLGMRDSEKVIEDFIEANTQKRTGKKKPFKVVWVCPLSDKKFREPIFVRKHIFNKHMDKVEAANKDNAIFFNNYLRDPRRPSLPEAPYHLTPQCYSSSSNPGPNPSYRVARGPNRSLGSGNYRGGYRISNQLNSNSLLPGPSSAFGRNPVPFQDYYDVAAQHQQQAMAAVAAAAAAALYPNAAAAADIYSLAAAGGGACPRTNGRRTQRGSPPSKDYGSRSFDTRRRMNTNFGSNNRRPFRPGDRSMISYNDLDDPLNDVSQ